VLGTFTLEITPMLGAHKEALVTTLVVTNAER